MDAGSAPASIYLDTSVVVAATFGGVTHSEQSVEFCSRLADRQSHVHFSQIVRLELSQVLVRLHRDVQLPAELRQTYQLDRWDADPMVRNRWMRFGVQEFEDLVARFAQLTEVPFDLGIWRASIDVMSRHRLRSHDAVHVATARRVGVLDFATIDDHFKRVRSLRLLLVR